MGSTGVLPPFLSASDIRRRRRPLSGVASKEGELKEDSGSGDAFRLRLDENMFALLLLCDFGVTDDSRGLRNEGESHT